MPVSCSAHRNVKAKINKEGIWLEELERNPDRFIPDKYRSEDESAIVHIDVNRPMKEIRAELTNYPIKTRLSRTGTLVVARDIAHAKIKERLDRGLPSMVNPFGGKNIHRTFFNVRLTQTAYTLGRGEPTC